MDNTLAYHKLIEINKKFMQFLHYWDTHKNENLTSPHSEYGMYRSQLIDAILLLDKEPNSDTERAITRARKEG